MINNNGNKPKSKKIAAAAPPQKKRRQRAQARRSQDGNSAPVATSRTTVVRVPRTIQTGSSIRVSHSELLATVMTPPGGPFDPEGFSVVKSLSINPGLKDTFPWLSLQAKGWEMYKFNMLRFRYVPRCSTATQGSVMIIPDYDADDLAPTTEQQASTYMGTSEDAPWKSHSVLMDVQSLNRTMERHYNRYSSVFNGDIKTYDVANLFVATSGIPLGNTVGKLWVDYDVTLYTPQLSTSTDAIAVKTGKGSPTDTVFSDATVSDPTLVEILTPNSILVKGLEVGQEYLASYRLEDGDNSEAVRFRPFDGNADFISIFTTAVESGRVQDLYSFIPTAKNITFSANNLAPGQLFSNAIFTLSKFGVGSFL